MFVGCEGEVKKKKEKNHKESENQHTNTLIHSHTLIQMNQIHERDERKRRRGVRKSVVSRGECVNVCLCVFFNFALGLSLKSLFPSQREH